MKLQHNVPLGSYSTMRLGGIASNLVEVKDRKEVAEAVMWAESNGLPVIMIGSGSNIVWSDNGFDGLVIVNKIKGYDKFKETDDNFFVTIGSGENWDKIVEKTVEQGLSGIEALSLIPGTAGATPVQNVGAYGQEIADTLVSVEAYDRQSKSFVNIPRLDCRFGYRTSRFKTEDKHRFFITAITLHLKTTTLLPPFYKALEDFMALNHITDHSPSSIRKSVIAIRNSKLPDPNIVANNGSFFANPIIDEEKFRSIHQQHPDIPNWPTSDGHIKLAAGWLVEKAGFKGYHDSETGMATWEKQSLVLVNESAKSTADLLTFKKKITDKVNELFGIELEQEPELI